MPESLKCDCSVCRGHGVQACSCGTCQHTPSERGSRRVMKSLIRPQLHWDSGRPSRGCRVLPCLPAGARRGPAPPHRRVRRTGVCVKPPPAAPGAGAAQGLPEGDIHAVSAATGQGVQALVRAVRATLDQLPQEAPSSEGAPALNLQVNPTPSPPPFLLRSPLYFCHCECKAAAEHSSCALLVVGSGLTSRRIPRRWQHSLLTHHAAHNQGAPC